VASYGPATKETSSMAAHPSVIGAAYDRIAEEYDTQWSVHVREPQQRLTRALGLAPGQRCADLACGTGTDTLEMLRLVAPGEVVAVDSSSGMLATTEARARAAGLVLSTRCEGVEEFVARAEPHGFDVVTLRFCLGYLDWKSMLGALPGLLRAGGRVGVLTILATSAPQAYAIYERMAEEFGAPTFARSSSSSTDEIEAGLRAGGAQIEARWLDRFQLWFRNGDEIARFLRESGIATHPMLSQLHPASAASLWKQFALRMEVYRTPRGIPLDFEIGTVIGRRTAP
jgi:ubiquinone/menaquinone biosynthesis C-methylase UbiE